MLRRLDHPRIRVRWLVRWLAAIAFIARTSWLGSQIPKDIPASGLIRAVRLVYDASNPMQLTVFETKGSTVAFEAMQTWRSQPNYGYHAAQMGRYLVIAQAEKPDPAGIEAFLADFKKQLK
jgi:hypothetical protein